MKSAFLFCSLLAFPFLSWAQSTIDFETVGQDFSWTVFGNLGNEPTLVQVVDNPDAAGDNTSTKVLQYTIQSGANTWAGLWTDDVGSITFTDDNKIVTIAVRKGSIANFDLKWENPGASIAVDNNVPNTVTGEWEIITFDCSSLIGSTVTRLSLLPDFQDGDTRTSSGDVFIDSITFSSGDTGGGGTQVDLPITFDEAGVDYTVVDFGDASTVLVADPTDASNMVACTTKPVSAPTWSGTTMSTNAGLATALPFSATATQVSVRVYSPDAGIQVRLKAEDKADVTHSVETEATTTVAGAWETLTFDFANEAEGTAALNLGYVFNKVSIFFNFGTDGATAGEKIYYWDDVTFTGETGSGGGGGETLPFETIDFESNSPTFTGFGGSNFAPITNPDPSGLNTSATVGSTMHGAETWAGIETLLADSLDFTTKNAMKMKVWSPTAGTFKFKIEAQSDAGINLDVDQTITADQINQWVELVFDFTGAAVDSYDKVALFFDFDVSSAQTFYFDDIEQLAAEVSSGGSGIDLPLGFDDSEVDYGLEDFGGTFSVLADDPADNSNTVVMTTKSSEAADWGGTTMVSSGLGTALPFAATDTQVSVRVYSPDAGIQVRLKAEDVADVTHTVETEATTTVANAWQTLTFDFANQAEGTAALNLEYVYNKLSIFFNFGVTGADAGEKVYYWEDVTFMGGTGGGSGGEPLPFETIDFEDAVESYTFSDFEGGVGSVIDNPGAAGINTSAKVGQMQKFAGATFAGSTLSLDGEVDFSTGNVFTMKVWASRSVPVTFKLEGLNVERIATHSGSSSWEELSFDFGSSVGAGVNGITLIFDNGVAGDAAGAAGDWTFYFDDISLGERTGEVPVATLPVTFEDEGGPYTFANFEGGVGSVIVNPGSAGINTSPKVGQMQKFAGATFGGSTLGLDGEVDFSAGNVFTMKVWASRSVPVTFKLEGLNVEQVATHSGSGSWENLQFDFTGSTGPGVSAITLIFDNGVAGNAAEVAADWTFYFDDITLSDGSIVPGPIDFEQDVSAIAAGAGTTVALIENPDRRGLNLSPNVASLVNPGGVESSVSVNFGGKLNLAAQSTFQVRVWSPKAGVTVRMMLGEGGTPSSVGSGSVSVLGTSAVFRDYVMTKTNEWELLTFDFAGEPTNRFDNLTLTFDQGSVDANTYYFDSLSLTEAGADNPHLVNVSTRGMVLTGEQILIVGFVIEGTSDKSMLIRGVGPTLSELAVVGALSDPYLEIYDADGNMVMENDDWSTGDVEALNDTMDAAGAFPLVPDSKDAAIVADFAPGIYTAHLYGVGGVTGVGMIEAYETQVDENRLVNISTRGDVGVGENVLIGGFVVSSNSCTVLIRAAGSVLSDYSVEGVLADPVLQIFDSNGVMIAENDDWSASADAAEIALVATDVGAFDFVESSNDSAILMTLGAGVYTAQVSGADGSTGVALVEVYEVQIDE